MGRPQNAVFQSKPAPMGGGSTFLGVLLKDYFDYKRVKKILEAPGVNHLLQKHYLCNQFAFSMSDLILFNLLIPEGDIQEDKGL